MSRLRIPAVPGVPFTFDAHGAVSLEIPPGREAEIENLLIDAIETLRAMPAEEPAPEARPRAAQVIGGIRPPPPPPGAISGGNGRRPPGMPAPPPSPMDAVAGVSALPQPIIKPPPAPPNMGHAAPSPVAPRVRSQHPNQVSSHRARPRIGPAAPEIAAAAVPVPPAFAPPIPAPMPAAAMPMNPPNQEGEVLIGGNGQPLRGAPMAALPQTPILAPPPPPDR
jgi:hypothetical protein